MNRPRRFFVFFSLAFIPHLLDQPWSRVSSFLPPGTVRSVVWIAQIRQHSRCSSIFIEILLTVGQLPGYTASLCTCTPPTPPSQSVTDRELLALTGPSQLHNNPELHLSRVAADSARRWLTATDAEPDDDHTMSGEEDNQDDREQVLM